MPFKASCFRQLQYMYETVLRAIDEYVVWQRSAYLVKMFGERPIDIGAVLVERVNQSRHIFGNVSHGNGVGDEDAVIRHASGDGGHQMFCASAQELPRRNDNFFRA